MKLLDRIEPIYWTKCRGIVVYPVTWEEAYVFEGRGGTAFLPIVKYSGEGK